MLGLKPIKLLPARERVASAIREAIIQKKIKEGEILTLDTTAQELEYQLLQSEKHFRFSQGMA